MASSIGTPGGTPARPAVFFDGPEEFRAWLDANHDSARELWLGLFKKHVADKGLTYAEAVREALCYGWIDSVAQRIDADATPGSGSRRGDRAACGARSTSRWSKS